MAFMVGPNWFYGLDAVFEVIAMLIALFIAFYSLKVYRLTRLRKYLYFMLAFLFLTFSFLLRAASDYVVYKHVLSRIPTITNAVQIIVKPPILYSLVFYGFVLFSLAGFMILVSIFLRIKSVKIVTLLFILTIIIAVMSRSTFLAFHATMFVMLLFISAYLYRNHLRRKKGTSFIVLYSMACLMAAHLFFILIIFAPFYYIVGHGLQLVGFLLLLLNMLLVFRK